MMNFKTLALSLTACAFAAGTANAAITISTNNSGGSGRLVSTASATTTAIAGGNATLHVGYFLNPGDAALKSGNLQTVLSSFIPLGENRPGLGATGGNFNVGSVTAGRWNTQIPGITGTNDAVNGVPNATSLVQGTRLFLLIYNTAQTEFALFGDSVLWLAPKDDPSIPGGASLTLAANITNLDAASSSTEVYWGSYPTAGGNFIAMAPVVPEPGAASVGLLAALGLLARRRRA